MNAISAPGFSRSRPPPRGVDPGRVGRELVRQKADRCRRAPWRRRAGRSAPRASSRPSSRHRARAPRTRGCRRRACGRRRAAAAALRRRPALARGGAACARRRRSGACRAQRIPNVTRAHERDVRVRRNVQRALQRDLVLDGDDGVGVLERVAGQRVFVPERDAPPGAAQADEHDLGVRVAAAVDEREVEPLRPRVPGAGGVDGRQRAARRARRGHLGAGRDVHVERDRPRVCARERERVIGRVQQDAVGVGVDRRDHVDHLRERRHRDLLGMAPEHVQPAWPRPARP